MSSDFGLKWFNIPNELRTLANVIDISVVSGSSPTMLSATLVIPNSKTSKEAAKYVEKKANNTLTLQERSTGTPNSGKSDTNVKDKNTEKLKCLEGQEAVVTGDTFAKTDIDSKENEIENHEKTNHEEQDQDHNISNKTVTRQTCGVPHISLNVRTVSKIVASLTASAFLYCKTDPEDLKLTNDDISITNEGVNIDSTVTPVRLGLWKVTFRPTVVGRCTLDIARHGYKKELEVTSNNPVDELSFYQECPTDIHVTRSNFVYVSYMHTVVKYSSGGIFLSDVVHDVSVFINYLAVSDRDGKIVTSGTKWTEESDNVYRSNHINVYSRMGVLLSSFPANSLQPESPFSLAISIDTNNHICTLTSKFIDFYDFDGNILKEVELNYSVGLCSKFSMDKENKFFVADSLSNNITVFNADGNFMCRFFGLQDTSISDNLGALSDVSVDEEGHILVSARFTNQIVVYNSTGETMAVIGSESSPLKWPSAVAVSGDGHVYVADHGHMTVKKYKYK